MVTIRIEVPGQPPVEREVPRAMVDMIFSTLGLQMPRTTSGITLSVVKETSMTFPGAQAFGPPPQ